DWRQRCDERAELELAVRRLNSEYGDGIGVLIGRVEERPRWIDVHATRPFTACRFPSDDIKHAGALVDLVHRHAVVAAIGVVEETAARVNADLGGRVRTVETLGQRWDRLYPDKCAALWLVVEHGDR